MAVATTAWWLRRPGPELAGPIEVSVPEGARLGTVADLLVDHGLLGHALPWVAWARLTGRDRALHWGDYLFTRAVSPLELLDRLTGPPDRLHEITFPEGLTLDEVVALLESRGFGPREAFRSVLADPAFLASEGLPPEGAEGYLYPDTYVFPRSLTPERMLRAMVGRFREVFGPEQVRRAAALGLDVQQAVTLASLVEEEAKRPEERPVIAAVFLNRLRRGMPLQSDPTVLYGRPPGDRAITRGDLRRQTPYNTYTSRGLPPTPIANPGRAALEAAVTPADVPYLYFVARGDGTHEFTSDLGAHNAAVARWRRR